MQMAMLGKKRLGPHLVLLCICLWGLANVRLVSSALCGAAAPRPGYEPTAMIPRFQPLAQWLPDTATTGYLLDGEHAGAGPIDSEARIRLAQYTLSPRLIRRTTACPLVIVDSDRPETPPNIAQVRGWTLVADLHNGVRLYRTRGPGP